MNEQKLFDKVKDILVDIYNLEPLEVIDDAYLKDDLGLDSLDVVEFTMEIEKEFEIRLEDEIMEHMVDWNVKQTVNYILTKIKK